jgi:hypothetical protein
MPLKLNCRRLRGYAFDPSLSLQVDTALLNETVFNVPWENVEIGPVGEYIEVVDYDPASSCFYTPVDLDEPAILAQDGVLPSESDPKFHQQMIYAVVMTTIRNFEKALGRKTLWAGAKVGHIYKNYVQRLRIYPHALREANAFYSPKKVALLFGYFPASSSNPQSHIPGGIVFTCLSHDIIAHETTHALLDGMHRRYVESHHPDGLAFHEAFADIVALFQHFTFPEVLRHQVAKTRGDLGSQNILGELAQEFGQAIGQYGALRDAIGGINAETKVWELKKPDPDDYMNVMEPHARGSILVAAIFDAFLTIYKTRIVDLLRIATSGTGVLPQGAIHPDLVDRLAAEAARSAKQVLGMCIRALDYCPPVDITFGDYLRAIITADVDLVPEDEKRYRVAFIDAFRRRGIYPRDIRNLSVDSLCWKHVDEKNLKDIFTHLSEQDLEDLKDEIDRDEVEEALNYGLDQSNSFRQFMYKMDYTNKRAEISKMTDDAKRLIHGLITQKIKDRQNRTWFENFQKLTGLVISTSRNFENHPLEVSGGFCKFEVHSLRGARRVGPNGNLCNQIIITLTQRRVINADTEDEFKFRGGCTLILDLETLSLRYVIKGKRIDDEQRLQRHIEYRNNIDRTSLRATYFGVSSQNNEPFALLHRGVEEE